MLVRMSFNIGRPLACYIEGFTFENYARFFTNSYHHGLLLFTLQLSVPVVLITLILAYIMAYVISRSSGLKRFVLMVITIFPIWINLVVLAFGWLLIFGRYGLINSILLALGLISEPQPLGYNFASVVVGLVYVCLPYIVLTLVSVLDSIDPAIEEAAKDLGAGKLRTFVEVTLPLSMPGIITGAMFSFIWTMSSFVIPSILGSPSERTFGIEISRQILNTLNWPYGAVMSLVLAGITVVAMLVSNKVREKATRWVS